MIHEFARILEAYQRCAGSGLRAVLATIVHVDGSSYRKEGTQMLIDEKRTITGALSGGCVEQEVWRQAGSVFHSGCPKVFKYDGRYRLGCEGSIYILIELFQPDSILLDRIAVALKSRETFSFLCAFSKEEKSQTNFGTSFLFFDKVFHPTGHELNSGNLEYRHQFSARRRLCIFGIEHDAATLSQLAYFLGWDVVVIGTEHSAITPAEFPFSIQQVNKAVELLDPLLFCPETAVIVMSHSYSKDLRFLLHILNTNVSYIGLLGPAHRRERILHEILEHQVIPDDAFFDKLHGPVGLDIGSETPEEIALSIMAEIVMVWNKKQIIQDGGNGHVKNMVRTS